MSKAFRIRPLKETLKSADDVYGDIIDNLQIIHFANKKGAAFVKKYVNVSDLVKYFRDYFDYPLKKKPDYVLAAAEYWYDVLRHHKAVYSELEVPVAKFAANQYTAPELRLMLSLTGNKVSKSDTIDDLRSKFINKIFWDMGLDYIEYANFIEDGVRDNLYVVIEKLEKAGKFKPVTTRSPTVKSVKRPVKTASAKSRR